MSKKLVIVESPTKANTIKKFLPAGYVVLASVGHIRDLPDNKDKIPAAIKGKPWADMAIDVEHDFEPYYVIDPGKQKLVRELKAALADADELLLATDEDREGESISWHLLEVLRPKVPARRMVFHEITRDAVAKALDHPRPIDENLVRAQETRRILDRLYGYTVSPLLWKKIGGKLSAGRVQSVAVRLLVQRERERRAFRSGAWWDVKATLQGQGRAFEATLASVGGRRLATGKDFDETTGALKARGETVLLDEAGARTLVAELMAAPAGAFVVRDVKREQKKQHPAAPFTTSTLTQEANRKLGMTPKDTMAAAQRLFQEGKITYHRTDSTSLSGEAIGAARRWVEQEYGADFLSERPRQYTTKSKGAQEAHEAIRPAGSVFVRPAEAGLEGRDLKLYDLIWKRTVATQMAEAVKTHLAVTIDAAGRAEFRATGTTIDFPGFLRAYVEGSDDPDEALADRDRPLPPLKTGDRPELSALEPEGHITQPPLRYTLASLVKALEEKGIGRPSTYASIIDTILSKEYAVEKGKALVPTFKAFAVTQILERHFADLVDYDFTAGMEEALDEIAAGRRPSVPYLREFYRGPKGLEQLVAAQSELLDPESARRIDLGDDLGVAVRIGRYGPYVEVERDGEMLRADVPDDIAPGDLDAETVERLLKQRADGPRSLGDDPHSGKPVFILDGRYGPYVQLGEAEGPKDKPPRASLLKGMRPDQVDLDTALALLSLPRLLGAHPDGGEVKAGVGRFGPFVLHARSKDDTAFRSLKAGDDVLTIDLARALELLAEEKSAGRGRGAGSGATVLRDMGEHPDGGPVQILDGRYGAYIKHGGVNATLPKGTDPAALSMAEAVELLAARAAKGGGKGRKGARATGKGAGKATAKRKPAGAKAARGKKGSRKG
jgi:DNA topoisomerase-1